MNGLLRSLNKASKCIVRAPNVLSYASASSSAAYQSIVANRPTPTVTTLQNGIRVASINSGGEHCSIGLWLDAGGRTEQLPYPGIPNLATSLMIKGSAKELEAEIGKIGGILDADTSYEHTYFSSVVQSKDVGKVVPILSRIVSNIKIDQLDNVKSEVLELIDSAWENPSAYSMAKLHETAYQGTPLGENLLGRNEHMSDITSDVMQEYIKDNLVGSKMIISASGDVEHEKLVKMVEGSSLSQIAVGEGRQFFPCRFTGSELRIRDDDMPFAYVNIALDGPGWDNSKDMLPMVLASYVLGNYSKLSGAGYKTGSKLAQVVHKEDWAYSFQSFVKSYHGTSLWGLAIIADRMQLDWILHATTEEFMRISSSLTDFEVERARNLFLTDKLRQWEGKKASAKNLARQVSRYGAELRSFKDFEDRVASISAKDVHNALLEYVYDRCPAIVGYGPIEAMTDYNRLRSNMYWARY